MLLAHAPGAGTSLPPLVWSTAITESSLSVPAAIVVVALTSAYVVGVRRLRQRGRAWPLTRTLSYFTGVAAIAAGTMSGLAAYDGVLFSAHAAQHVAIGVVAPFFLALGAPITLALQASKRGTQVRLIRLLHARPVRAVSHPLVAWALFGLTLFGLYFTPLYELSLRNWVVHEMVHLHFMFAGAVFFWVVVGLDPVARNVPYGFRLLMVLLTVPFHAFLGLVLVSGDQPIAASYYESVQRPTGASILADQHTGAGVMWAVGDAIGVVAGGVVVAQWMLHEERRARRADARLDAAPTAPGSAP